MLARCRELKSFAISEYGSARGLHTFAVNFVDDESVSAADFVCKTDLAERVDLHASLLPCFFNFGGHVLVALHGFLRQQIRRCILNHV